MKPYRVYKGYMWIGVCFFMLVMLKFKEEIVTLDILTLVIFGMVIYIDSKYLMK